MSGPDLRRFAQWSVEPDRDPRAERATYVMQCGRCRRTSPICLEWDDAARWAAQHAARNPSHQTYRETITRPWRATLGGAGG
ncbi:DUF7848 domain-containing protein [Streptomyces sp. URMC 129]|uniref:DUF7848 domain-containing protein n=1 Tax=Streptomyces sp. URMC 129 TaxID=3423407 RepID=UPI003F5307E3